MVTKLLSIFGIAGRGQCYVEFEFSFGVELLDERVVNRLHHAGAASIMAWTVILLRLCHDQFLLL
jgi:hypothetical protein